MTDYKPLVVKGTLRIEQLPYQDMKKKLKGQGFTCNQMKAMVRFNARFNGLTLYLSKWSYDDHKCWHIWNWDQEIDTRVMLGIYEAEQFHPMRDTYKNDFATFERDWKAGEYDPDGTITFTQDQVEVIEVIQEEEDNRDRETMEKAKKAASKQTGGGYVRRRPTKKKFRRKKKGK